MRTIFDGNVFAHYGMAYVHLNTADLYNVNMFRGQTNGLLGAAHPSALQLNFVLHTGYVHLVLRIADAEPPLEDEWQEVVEASFLMPALPANSGAPKADGRHDMTGDSDLPEMGLSDWNGDTWHPINLSPGWYRTRYTGRNLGQPMVTNVELLNSSNTEHYELTFWPAPREDDAVLRATTAYAVEAHRFVSPSYGASGA